MKLRSLVVVTIGVLMHSMVLSQPCLTGWTYRVPVIINNTGNASTLTNYQVHLDLNTQDLIANGKAQLDGGDIRFLDKNGSVLPFWIENNTYNTSSTQIWIKVPSIQGSVNDTIYLFYGQPDATYLANGDETFELFDDFIGSSVDAAKWDICNPSEISVSGGNITFTSGVNPSKRATLSSLNGINAPIIMEGYCESAVGGQAFIGLTNASGNGYAMEFENNLGNVMRLLKIDNDTNCLDLSNVTPANSASRSASTIVGIWSFAWFTGNQQTFDWPGATSIETRNDFIYPYSTAPVVHPTIGSIDSSGTFELDWIRARKYTSVEPTTSLGVETPSVTDVEVSGNGPICNGSDINLTASNIQSGIYSWSGPNGFTSTDQNPSITSATHDADGYYYVVASISGACSSATDSIYVKVDSNTVSGVLDGDTTLCSGGNNSSVVLSGNVGDVVRWESSLSGEAPWQTINETNNTLNFIDLNATTFYRAVIKSGVCLTQVTDSSKITIDDTTVAGNVLGAIEVCSDTNNGNVTLYNNIGSVLNWERFEEGGSSWIPMIGTSTTFEFSDLNITTWYRAKVQNGVCYERFSDSVKITVNPLPSTDFTAVDVCQGVPMEFNDATTISSGSIVAHNWNFNDGTGSTISNPEHIYSSSGDFDVILKTESNKGCVREISKEVTVYALPQVDFFSTNVCQREGTSFTDNTFITPPYSIDNLVWDFGDNIGTSTLQNPTYEYDTSGVYSTKLVAESGNGCKDSLTKTNKVYHRGQLSFNSDPVFLGETSEFDNNSVIAEGNLSYDWRFDDGQSSTLSNPNHTYTYADTFQVILIGTSSLGNCVDSVTIDHIVHNQTKADFSVENVCLYDSAKFINSSFIPSGTLSYIWDFGDGGSDSLTNPAHLYDSPGTYVVKLTATSNLGSTDEVVKSVTIYPLPTANYSSSSVCEGDATIFTNLSSIANGTLSYQWDFGDMNTSTDVQPEHTYSTSGSFIVQLIATSGNNCIDTTSNNITVHPTPVTLFNVDAVCDGFPSLFEDSTIIASGTIEQYSWDFGDGTNSIEQNPSKQFLNASTYTVKLTTTSDQQCSSNTSKNVEVYAAPIADFSVEDVCFKETANPVNASSTQQGVMSYLWNMGDGSTSTLVNPSHLYGLPGLYSIQLKVTTDLGCVDSITSSIVINTLPTIEAGEDQEVSKGYSVELSVTEASQFIWTPGETLNDQGVINPIATPLETTVYTVSATDDNGCVGTAQQTVTVIDDFKLVPSNVITPDGNGINDNWYIENITSFEEAEISVFDRWGKRVFNVIGYNNDWSGISGTDILPDGEYYYIIVIPGKEKNYKGTITVLRNNR